MVIIGILGLFACIDCPGVTVFIESGTRSSIRVTGPGGEIIAFHAWLTCKRHTQGDKHHQRNEKHRDGSLGHTFVQFEHFRTPFEHVFYSGRLAWTLLKASAVQRLRNMQIAGTLYKRY